MAPTPPLLQRPVLASDFRLIGPAPQLSARTSSPPECVDHHAFRGPDGAWHLWGCIRGVETGRILYHWEGEALDRGPWRQTGETIRTDPASGESLADWEGQEWVQSPFIVYHDGFYYFIYGGHSTGLDHQGNEVPSGDPRTECQICLMISPDGRNWQRYRDPQGFSRLFAGPGEARDPCVIRIGETWHLYYAGHESGDPFSPGVYLRVSLDLIHWSLPRLVQRSRPSVPGRWTHECPHVVQRGDVFYLFRTEDYDQARTHVYWSKSPVDFGVDLADPDHYLGLLPVAAPEVIVDEAGREYLTSCHAMTRGIQICRLDWTAV